MRIRYYKLTHEDNYAIWGRKITSEKCFYSTDDAGMDEEHEFSVWHNPEALGAATIPEMMKYPDDYDITIIPLTEEEAFLEMI